MKLTRVYFAATLAAAVIATTMAPPSVRAQMHAPATRVQGIPCHVSWHAQTSGGDTLTADGEAELTQIMPQGDGRFTAFGNGHATVTFHPLRGSVTAGSPWVANYDVTIASEDGLTAQVDIGSDDDEHSVTVALGPGHATFDTEAPGLPRVIAELHEGVTAFGVSHTDPVHGAGGRSGTVTLHYCTLGETH